MDHINALEDCLEGISRSLFKESGEIKAARVYKTEEWRKGPWGSTEGLLQVFSRVLNSTLTIRGSEIHNPKVLGWILPSEHTGPGITPVPVSQNGKALNSQALIRALRGSCLWSGRYLALEFMCVYINCVYTCTYIFIPPWR